MLLARRGVLALSIAVVTLAVLALFLQLRDPTVDLSVGQSGEPTQEASTTVAPNVTGPLEEGPTVSTDTGRFELVSPPEGFEFHHEFELSGLLGEVVYGQTWLGPSGRTITITTVRGVPSERLLADNVISTATLPGVNQVYESVHVDGLGEWKTISFAVASDVVVNVNVLDGDYAQLVETAKLLRAD